MLFSDALTLDAPKRTKDGYMAVRAKAARTGVYQYAGHEVDPTNAHGLRDKAIVNVLRDEKTVFDKAAVQSFIGKPVTDDHPSEAVTSANWRDHARGIIMGGLREGDYLTWDLLLADAGTIAKVEAGKRELSNGYAADLEFGQFTAPDGTICDARQDRILDGNHVALVRAGRAGSACRIADAAPCASMSEEFTSHWLADQRTYDGGEVRDNSSRERSDASKPFDGGSQVATKTMTFDGLPLEVTDAAEAAINKLQGQLATAVSAKDKATADLAAANTTIQTKDGEIAALNAKLADATDPAKQALRDAARASVIVGAQHLKPGITVDGKSDADIRKEAVTAKLGDAAKDMADAAIEGAFLALTKDAKPADPLRDALTTNGVRPLVNDSGASVRDLARAAQY